MPKFWTACGVYVYKFDKYGPFILSGENESLHLSAVDLFPAANPKLVGKTAWFVQKHRLERVQSPPMDIDGYGDDCIKNSSKKKNRNLGENMYLELSGDKTLGRNGWCRLYIHL
jgi:hypothetical protein